MNKEKAKFTFSMVIYGTIGLLRRNIPYSSGFIAFVRGGLGVLFLVLMHLVKREKFSWKLIKENLVLLIVSGALIGFNWIFLFESYRYTSIAVGTICYYMAPVIVILVSPVFLKEKIGLRKGICSAIAVLGMIFVSGVLENDFYGFTGVLFGLGAAAMYASVIILNKKFKEGLETSERTIFQLLFATIAVFPYVLLTDNFAEMRFDLVGVLLLILAGILQTGIAYSMFFAGIKVLPATTVAILSYIDPVVAVVISAVILREGISLLAVAGVVLVIASSMISEIGFIQKKAA